MRYPLTLATANTRLLVSLFLYRQASLWRLVKLDYNFVQFSPFLAYQRGLLSSSSRGLAASGAGRGDGKRSHRL